MTYFVIRRTFWGIFLFFVATIVTYLIFFVIPSNPAQLSGGHGASPTIINHIKHELHLDLPIYQQYWIFFWNIIRHGSLGQSFVNGVSVDSYLRTEAPITGSLVLGGAICWLALSIPIGILSALRSRTLLDRGAMLFVLIGISAPPVLVGLVLAYIFGFKLGWTPIADYCNFLPTNQIGVCSGPGQWAYHLILPWLTFMFGYAALYVRLIRAGVIETMAEDYVRTARAKGASPARVLFHHVLRNSMLPVVTILGMDVGLALGGVVFTEYVFNLNGLGQELVLAADQDNLPVTVGIVVFVTVCVIVFNFLVDIAYAWLDPRIRLTT